MNFVPSISQGSIWDRRVTRKFRVFTVNGHSARYEAGDRKGRELLVRTATFEIPT